MSFYANDGNKLLKSAVTGVLISVAVTAALICVFALILNLMSGVPYGVIDYIVIAIQGFSVFAGAYIAAAVIKYRGLLTGVICAFAVLIINLAFAMGSGAADISLITAIRAVVLVICGIAGGILGVNKKERIRIH